MRTVAWGAALTALLLALTGCDKDGSQSGKTREDARPPQAAPKTGPMPGGNLERIQASKRLRIGVKADSPPFGYLDKDGNPQGFDVDLGFRIARALGVQPHYVTVTSADRIEKLKSGEIDCIIATFTATRRRAKEVDFSLPYFQDQQQLLVKAASPIQSYRDLSGKKIGVAEGSTSIQNLKIVAPDGEAVGFKSVTAAFQALADGKVDAVTGDGMALLALKMGAPDAGAYRIAGEGFSVEAYVIGLPRNDSDLRARMDEILTELWNSGVWTRLFHKWLGAQSPYNLQAQFQMQVLPP